MTKRLKVRSQLQFLLANVGGSGKDCSLADYEILKEWYNLAILELVELDDFRPKLEWIAKSLGIIPFLVKRSTQFFNLTKGKSK